MEGTFGKASIYSFRD